MHTSFYARGFVYHSPSHQILLQQVENNTAVSFSLFQKKSPKEKSPHAVFRECIEETLGVSIHPQAIHEVYDYIHDKLGALYVFYVEVTDSNPNNFSSKENTAWIPLSKLSKQAMTNQTRHDIIIAERVIRSLLETPHTGPGGTVTLQT